MHLLATNNKKIMKGRDRGYIIFGMHLLPGRTCNRASKGCLASCLNLVGNGLYPSVQQARARKTKLFWNNPSDFIDLLHEDIRKALKVADKIGLEPVFRLNLTSDIPWECYGLPQKYPDVQWYDYTKYHDRHPPDNYHLTFSRSESLINHQHAKSWLARGGNVAAVFPKNSIPKTYWNYPIIDGDNDDLRFLDPKNVVVALTAKGKAQTDKTGFVVRAA